MWESLQNVFSAIERDHIPPVCFLCSSDPDAAEDAAFSVAARFCGREESKLSAYPDFFDIECPIKIDALRELLRECDKRSFSEGNRCIRITKAHLLSEMEQNLLLKTFEEPPRRSLFLLCGNLAAMLPTIQSRCSLIRLGSPRPAEIEEILKKRGIDSSTRFPSIADSLAQAEALIADPEARDFRTRAQNAFCRLLSGEPPFSLSKELQKDKASASLLLSYWLSFCRDLLAYKFGVPVRNTDIKKQISDFSPRFTSEQINCIIELLTAASARLQTNVSAVASLDGMMTRILEEVTQSDK